MHRYFLIFEAAFLIIMVYFWGWWAGGVAGVFIVLSVIANLCREEEREEKFALQRFNYEKQMQESYQDIYKKILDEVPGAANLIGGYYYERDKADENFLVKYSKEKMGIVKNMKRKRI